MDLVVQSLLRGLALSQQPAAEPDRGQQCLVRVVLVDQDGPAVALPGEVGQGGAVAVVGLEPA